eukprot:Rmarinus@m.23232
MGKFRTKALAIGRVFGRRPSSKILSSTECSIIKKCCKFVADNAESFIREEFPDLAEVQVLRHALSKDSKVTLEQHPSAPYLAAECVVEIFRSSSRPFLTYESIPWEADKEDVLKALEHQMKCMPPLEQDAFYAILLVLHRLSTVRKPRPSILFRLVGAILLAGDQPALHSVLGFSSDEVAIQILDASSMLCSCATSIVTGEVKPDPLPSIQDSRSDWAISALATLGVTRAGSLLYVESATHPSDSAAASQPKPASTSPSPSAYDPAAPSQPAPPPPAPSAAASPSRASGQVPRSPDAPNTGRVVEDSCDLQPSPAKDPTPSVEERLLSSRSISRQLPFLPPAPTRPASPKSQLPSSSLTKTSHQAQRSDSRLDVPSHPYFESSHLRNLSTDSEASFRGHPPSQPQEKSHPKTILTSKSTLTVPNVAADENQHKARPQSLPADVHIPLPSKSMSMPRTTRPTATSPRAERSQARRSIPAEPMVRMRSGEKTRANGGDGRSTSPVPRPMEVRSKIGNGTGTEPGAGRFVDPGRSRSAPPRRRTQAPVRTSHLARYESDDDAHATCLMDTVCAAFFQDGTSRSKVQRHVSMDDRRKPLSSTARTHRKTSKAAVDRFLSLGREIRVGTEHALAFGHPRNKPKLLKVSNTLDDEDDQHAGPKSIEECVLEPEPIAIVPEDADPSLPSTFELACFVFPTGLQIKTTSVPPVCHNFVITKETGHQQYGFCLTRYSRVSLSEVANIARACGCPPPSEYQDYFAPNALCLMSTRPLHRTFLGILTAYASGLTQNARLTKALVHDLLEFTQRVLPHPGAPRVPVHFGRYKILPTPMASLKGDLPIADVDYMVLLRYLPASAVPTILAAMLKEYQIVFVATNAPLLGVFIPALLSLFYPFHWQFPCVPVAPASLNATRLLMAPCPVLVGITRDRLQELPENDDQPLLVVDVDAGKLRYERRAKPASLPTRTTTRITRALEKFYKGRLEHVRKEQERARPETPPLRTVPETQTRHRDVRAGSDPRASLRVRKESPTPPSNSPPAHSRSLPRPVEKRPVTQPPRADWEAAYRNLRTSVLSAFVSILHGYRQCLKTGASALDDPLDAFDDKKFESFLKKQYLSWFRTFKKSQMFANFLQERAGLCEERELDAFDFACDKLLKRKQDQIEASLEADGVRAWVWTTKENRWEPRWLSLTGDKLTVSRSTKDPYVYCTAAVRSDTARVRVRSGMQRFREAVIDTAVLGASAAPGDGSKSKAHSRQSSNEGLPSSKSMSPSRSPRDSSPTAAQSSASQLAIDPDAQDTATAFSFMSPKAVRPVGGSTHPGKVRGASVGDIAAQIRSMSSDVGADEPSRLSRVSPTDNRATSPDGASPEPLARRASASAVEGKRGRGAGAVGGSATLARFRSAFRRTSFGTAVWGNTAGGRGRKQAHDDDGSAPTRTRSANSDESDRTSPPAATGHSSSVLAGPVVMFPASAPASRAASPPVASHKSPESDTVSCLHTTSCLRESTTNGAYHSAALARCLGPRPQTPTHPLRTISAGQLQVERGSSARAMSPAMLSVDGEIPTPASARKRASVSSDRLSSVTPPGTPKGVEPTCSASYLPPTSYVVAMLFEPTAVQRPLKKTDRGVRTSGADRGKRRADTGCDSSDSKDSEGGTPEKQAARQGTHPVLLGVTTMDSERGGEAAVAPDGSKSGGGVPRRTFSLRTALRAENAVSDPPSHFTKTMYLCFGSSKDRDRWSKVLKASTCPENRKAFVKDMLAAKVLQSAKPSKLGKPKSRREDTPSRTSRAAGGRSSKARRVKPKAACDVSYAAGSDSRSNSDQENAAPGHMGSRSRSQHGADASAAVGKARSQGGPLKHRSVTMEQLLARVNVGEIHTEELHTWTETSL